MFVMRFTRARKKQGKTGQNQHMKGQLGKSEDSLVDHTEALRLKY